MLLGEHGITEQGLAFRLYFLSVMNPALTILKMYYSHQFPLSLIVLKHTFQNVKSVILIQMIGSCEKMFIYVIKKERAR